MRASPAPSESHNSPDSPPIRGPRAPSAVVNERPREPAETPSGRLPDFFIVGHEKCGTTALHLMLSSHPQIFMPAVKELRFFAPELRSRFRRFGPERLPLTLDQYSRLFAPARADQLAGEASPLYLRSHNAAQRIAETCPDARI